MIQLNAAVSGCRGANSDLIYIQWGMSVFKNDILSKPWGNFEIETLERILQDQFPECFPLVL